MKMKRVRFRKKASNTPSKPNRWIYACIKEVEVNDGEGKGHKTVLSLKSADKMWYLDYLKGKNVFLNALNLMSDKDHKFDQTTQIIHERIVTW